MPLPSEVLTGEAEGARARARMTQNQLEALSLQLAPLRLAEEMAELPRRRTLVLASGVEMGELEARCLNGWNTEFLLRSSATLLSGEALRSSLQWAFPQAYYSVFSLTLGYFLVAGYTERSHSAVIKKVGERMAVGDYPRGASFMADGGNVRIYLNIARTTIPFSTYFDRSDTATIETQICQFLNGTRDRDLDERKRKVPITTKRGIRKRHFSAVDWERVSQSLGRTNVLSLLYRKRIKANYEDIDTYLSEHLDPVQAHADLIGIVGSLNLVHEAFILKAVGGEQYEAMVRRAAGTGNRWPETRLGAIRLLPE